MAVYKKIAAATLLCIVSASLHAADLYFGNRQSYEQKQVEQKKYNAAVQTVLKKKFEEKKWLTRESEQKQREIVQYIQHYDIILNGKRESRLAPPMIQSQKAD